MAGRGDGSGRDRMYCMQFDICRSDQGVSQPSEKGTGGRQEGPVSVSADGKLGENVM